MATKELPKQSLSAKTALLVIIAVTLISYLPTFSNGYVFWDDPEYVLNNPLMTAPLKVVFTTPYLCNYHPLTILLYTLEHKFFGTGMTGYHAISLLLHILNSLFVFFFIYFLLNKKNVMIPLVTALLFAVHPMHVESVAWASELKDVLYTFFFLGSLICYVWYSQRNKQLKYLAYALVLYLLSLISKGQAVTLPLCFLLVDYFLNRKLSVKLFLDKIPFFALSLGFGLLAIKFQGPEEIHRNSEFFERFFWGFYGLSLYLYKFILPINLSGLYPYPINPDRSMPIVVYVFAIFISIVLVVIIRMFRKNKFVMFGLFFFLANIFTLLKFIPIGDAIIADRYSYIPYIGLFFVVGYGFHKLLNNPAYKPRKKIIQYAGIGLLVVLSTLTWARVTVWKDNISFWTDAISKNSGYWRPYYCIGQDYYDQGNYPDALKYYTGAIKNDKYCPPLVFMWRGVTYLEQFHNTDSAIADFKKVLDFGNKSDPSQIQGRLNLGLAYYRKGMYDDALKIYSELLTMDPGNETGYFQRGLVYQYGKPPQPQLALADYTKAIQLNPSYGLAYMNRGSLYVDQLHTYDPAIADFTKALELDPTNKDALLDKGIAYYKKGDFDNALEIYNSVRANPKDNGKLFYLKALSYAGKKDYANAVQNAEQAQKMGLSMDAGELQEWKSKM
jgi:protein O-mannosyl-transferase